MFIIFIHIFKPLCYCNIYCIFIEMIKLILNSELQYTSDTHLRTTMVDDRLCHLRVLSVKSRKALSLNMYEFVKHFNSFHQNRTLFKSTVPRICKVQYVYVCKLMATKLYLCFSKSISAISD